MWFKNLAIYHFVEPFPHNALELTEQLYTMPFSGVGKIQMASMGWYPPLDMEDDAPLVHAANGMMLLCLKIEERLLPAKVINELLGEKIQEIESREDRKVYSKEKMRIKDELIYTLLPQAFTQSNKIYAYIDTQRGYLIVDTSSRNKAELLCSQLRRTLGSLKVTPLEVKDTEAVLTNWLSDQDLPANLHITDSCVLRHPQHTSAVIRCKGEDVFHSNIQTFIDDGFGVTELALGWHDQTTFVLTDDFIIKRLGFTDMVKEQANDNFSETEAQAFDANFTIMTATLNAMLEDVLQYFALAQPESLESGVKALAAMTEEA